MGNEEIRLLRADELGFTYRFDVVAAGLAKTDGNERQAGGAGTATAHVAVTTNGTCELVSVGGLATARSDETSLSASQWASLCLA